MSQLIGTWVSGDTGKKLRYTVEEDGTAFDVTGATLIILTAVRVGSSGDTVDTSNGSIYGTATNGTFEFATIGTDLASPASRMQSYVYECRITFTKSGLVYWTDAFRLALVKFP